ncbi:histone-lysine N-methyltransferase PRDM16-like [Strongylocentrotus purpuratus]|uniref:C2H2-type domain-containing protein n=1 Tax=Strongylocentrotus purpuratus TaxID=7668 RepID=A0A7M7NIC5_STRPU|nr:histone-lysine N-methyltransferase PRDM16-like [Strongylocentrotus purpuratus]
MRHSRGNVKCYSCGHYFSHKRSLERHIQERHRRREEHKCRGCDKSFFRKDNLTRHVQSRHEGKTTEDKRQDAPVVTPVAAGELSIHASKETLSSENGNASRPTGKDLSMLLKERESETSSVSSESEAEVEDCPTPTFRKIQMGRPMQGLDLRRTLPGTPLQVEERSSSTQFSGARSSFRRKRYESTAWFSCMGVKRKVRRRLQSCITSHRISR